MNMSHNLQQEYYLYISTESPYIFHVLGRLGMEGGIIVVVVIIFILKVVVDGSGGVAVSLAVWAPGSLLGH